MPDDKMVRYRYPGTKPFEAEEHELFKGRADDVEKLSELISLQNLVVLFGRSGLGKSSLLNAGLVNRFRNHPGIVPLFVRFGAYHTKSNASPLNRLQQAFVAQAGRAAPSNFIYEKLIAREDIAQHQLWYFFKSYQIARPQHETIVLIFDQFEELFTYPEAEIGRLKKELSELLYLSVPQQLRNLLKDKLRLDAAYLNEGEKETLFRPLNVRALFSIRSDKLSLLNNFTDCFPAVLQHCYELKPLTEEQARQAVEEPAQLDDEKYASPPFLFTGEAVAVLMKALTEAKRGKEQTATGRSTEIETFQLQIVCRHAESTVIEKGLRRLTAADLGDIKAIFENHYRNIIDRFPPVQRLPAQRLMEEKLIIDGNRVSMPVPFILRDEGMTPGLLDELINTHILRREQANTVEISHDTLVEPILKQYEERKKEEAVAAELQEKEAQLNKIKKEQEEQAAAQKQKAKRNRVLLSLISAALILMIGLAGFAFKNANAANEQRMAAEQQKVRADSIAKVAVRERDKAERYARNASAASESAYEALRVSQIDSVKAVRSAADALQQATIARQALSVSEAQKKIVTQSSEAFRLITLARQVAEKNPTVALRIAEIALQKKSDSLIQKEAEKIYAQHAFYKTIEGGSYGVYPVSPDGKWIFTYDNVWNGGSSQGMITIRSMEGTLLKAFKTNSSTGKLLAVSADGHRILLGSYDSTVRLLDENGKLLKEFKIKAGRITALALSSNGKKLAVGGSDSSLYLWKAGDNALQKMTIPEAVTCVAYSPTSDKILAGSIWSIPRLWTAEGVLVKEFKENERFFTGTFSPDGTKILTGNLDSTAKLWSVDGTLLKEFRGHSGDIRSVTFSPDETKILTGSSDKTARLWSTNGMLLKEFKGHDDAVSAVIFSSDGRKILTADNSLRIWNIENVPLNEFKLKDFDRDALVFSPDKTKILAVRSNTVQLLGIEGQRIREYGELKGKVLAMAFSADGNKILVSTADNITKVLTLEGKLVSEIKEAGSMAAFSPDGKSFLLAASLAGGYRYRLSSWSTEGRPLQRFEDASHSAYTATFSPDGKKILITGGNRHTGSHPVRLLNLDGTVAKEFEGSASYLYATAFSPDGTRVLGGAGDGNAFLWDINGKLLQAFDSHDATGIIAVAFSPEGRKILTAAGGGGGEVKLWTESGKLIESYGGRNNREVVSLTFSADGTKIYTASYKGVITAWNTTMEMDEFLQSNNLAKLTVEQRKEYRIE